MFFGLRTLLLFVIPIGICTAAVAASVLVYRKRNLIRFPVFLLSSPIAILTLLFTVMQFAALGCQTRSKPIFSPDHHKAVLVESEDDGALGGWTSLELLAKHGFSSHTIFRGDWGTVDQNDVHWSDSSHVMVKYNPTGRSHDCFDTPSVQVICNPQDPPRHSGYLLSPDHILTAGLRKAKDGSYNGTDAVTLLDKGWDANYLYVGEPDSVDWSHTRWTGNRTLEIVYKGKEAACEKSDFVQVVCTRIMPQEVPR